MSPTKRPLLPLALAAAGCSVQPVQQQPLGSAGPPPPPAASRSLVLGGTGAADGWIERRNDEAAAVDREGRLLYYGPGGRLYYADGTPTPFTSLRKQLQDLRSEQSIGP